MRGFPEAQGEYGAGTGDGVGEDRYGDGRVGREETHDRNRPRGRVHVGEYDRTEEDLKNPRGGAGLESSHETNPSGPRERTTRVRKFRRGVSRADGRTEDTVSGRDVGRVKTLREYHRPTSG